jgi:hypothetical protein
MPPQPPSLRRFAAIPPACLLLLLLPAPALAQRAPEVARTVALPFNLSDNAGLQWMVYGNGMLQHQGNNPVFAQLATLAVNGNSSPMMRGGQNAKQDEKTGELLLENISMAGVTVSRRILIDRDALTVRYVDTFRNNAANPLTANITYSTNLHFGVQQSRPLIDPRRKGEPVGHAAMTQANRAMYTIWAGPAPASPPRLNAPEGGNVVQTSFSLELAPRAEVAIVHIHGLADSLDKAAELGDAASRKLGNDLPASLRKILANTRKRTGLPDDLEVLRGETLDVLETRGGDQLRGTLKDPTFSLKTDFGQLELPADRILGVIMLGQFLPRQLLVTTDGEIFGGTPQSPALTVELTSGQTLRVPVSQVQRAGFRKRSGEPDDTPQLTKPAVFLRSGERMAILTPTASLDFATRYGLLKLSPSAVSEIILRSEDSPVHIVTLTDGTRLAGLLTSPSIPLTLDGAAGPQQLSLPIASIARLRPQPVAPDAEDAPLPAGPELRAAGGDSLRGELLGDITLETAFEAVKLGARQIRSIVRPDAQGPAGSEWRVTLWDNTLVTGIPAERSLTLKLAGGLELSIPADLISSYTNTAAIPNDHAASNVKELVAQLNDDNFRTRESAQAKLLDAGKSILPLLKELRPSQPPEAQTRLDAIIAKLESGK